MPARKSLEEVKLDLQRTRNRESRLRRRAQELEKENQRLRRRTKDMSLLNMKLARNLRKLIDVFDTIDDAKEAVTEAEQDGLKHYG